MKRRKIHTWEVQMSFFSEFWSAVGWMITVDLCNTESLMLTTYDTHICEWMRVGLFYDASFLPLWWTNPRSKVSFGNRRSSQTSWSVNRGPWATDTLLSNRKFQLNKNPETQERVASSRGCRICWNVEELRISKPTALHRSPTPALSNAAFLFFF